MIFLLQLSPKVGKNPHSVEDSTHLSLKITAEGLLDSSAAGFCNPALGSFRLPGAPSARDVSERTVSATPFQLWKDRVRTLLCRTRLSSFPKRAPQGLLPRRADLVGLGLQGDGPEREGKERDKGTQGTRKAVHSACGVEAWRHGSDRQSLS
jgi:hypothetical protein